MELLSFTSRQINSLNASLALFNFAVVCDPEQIPAVERALKKCYDHISRLYAYNKAEPVHPGKPNVLTIDCLKIFIKELVWFHLWQKSLWAIGLKMENFHQNISSHECTMQSCMEEQQRSF